jgi:hypothetical protein
MLSRAGDYWDDATRTTGTGIVAPLIRGLFEQQFASDATANITMKIISQTSNTVTFKAKVSDGGTYGSGTQTVTKGAWVGLQNESGIFTGTLGMPGQVYYPAGTYVANDEWNVLRRRAIWTPSFPGRNVVNEVNSLIYFDDLIAEVEQMQMTMKNGSSAVFGFGGQAAKRTQKVGSQEISGNFNRPVLNLDVRHRLEMNKPFKIQSWLRSGIAIGSSVVYDYSVKITAAGCIPSGKTPTVENKSTYKDALAFTCNPSADGTYPDDVYVELFNDIPDLAAA